MSLNRASSRHIAIACALAALTARPVVAQQSLDTLTDSAVAERLGYHRSVKTAIVLGSVVPGAGHLYAGEWLKSYPIFLASVGGIPVGALIFNFDRCSFAFLNPDCPFGVPIGARIAGAAMVGGAVAIWVGSARDAGHAVERQRVRRARKASRVGSVRPLLAPCGEPSGGAWCVGLSLGSAPH